MYLLELTIETEPRYKKATFPSFIAYSPKTHMETHWIQLIYLLKKKVEGSSVKRKHHIARNQMLKLEKVFFIHYLQLILPRRNI